MSPSFPARPSAPLPTNLTITSSDLSKIHHPNLFFASSPLSTIRDLYSFVDSYFVSFLVSCSTVQTQLKLLTCSLTRILLIVISSLPYKLLPPILVNLT